MRLTEKSGGIDNLKLFSAKLDNLLQVINKLGQLEDIEEDLGIDLITLFKALKKGVWVREQNTKEKEIVYERIRLNFLIKTLDFIEPRKEIGIGRNLFDYGDSWALTKEELL